MEVALAWTFIGVLAFLFVWFCVVMATESEGAEEITYSAIAAIVIIVIIGGLWWSISTIANPPSQEKEDSYTSQRYEQT